MVVPAPRTQEHAGDDRRRSGAVPLSGPGATVIAQRGVAEVRYEQTTPVIASDALSACIMVFEVITTSLAGYTHRDHSRRLARGRSQNASYFRG